MARLTAAGGTISGIAWHLGVTRTMVRRYRFADAPPEREYARRPGRLDRYEPYLRRRWAEGCRNAQLLRRELRAQGYPGQSRQVSRWADRPARPRSGGAAAGAPADDPGAGGDRGRGPAGPSARGATAGLAAGARPQWPHRRGSGPARPPAGGRAAG